MSYPRMYGEIDMEAQIHQLEQEAYSSVLRAFKAQADAITWVHFLSFFSLSNCFWICLIRFKWLLNYLNFLQEKESLITELRKELRLSNEEHRELLGRVNADDVIRRIRSDKISILGCLLIYALEVRFSLLFAYTHIVILLINTSLDVDLREWRQTGGHQPGLLTSGQVIHDSNPSPTVSASRKKPKITPSVPSQSFGGPSPSFHPQPGAAPHQPSSSVGKRGSVPGSKGKKQKPVSKYRSPVILHFFSLFIWSELGFILYVNRGLQKIAVCCRATQHCNSAAIWQHFALSNVLRNNNSLFKFCYAIVLNVFNCGSWKIVVCSTSAIL